MYIQFTLTDQQLNQRTFGKRDTASTWHNAGPVGLPVGGRARSLLILNNTMLMGSVSGGIFKSVDSGNSWFPVSDMMANIAIGCLAAKADWSVIYAGTGEGWFNNAARRGAGIFVSYDGAEFIV